MEQHVAGRLIGDVELFHQILLDRINHRIHIPGVDIPGGTAHSGRLGTILKHHSDLGCVIDKILVPILVHSAVGQIAQLGQSGQLLFLADIPLFIHLHNHGRSPAHVVIQMA